jgi:hypothetical protein
MQRPFETMSDRAVRGSLREPGTWLHIAGVVLGAAAAFWVVSLALSALVGADGVAFAPLEAIVLGAVLVAVARWRTRSRDQS